MKIHRPCLLAAACLAAGVPALPPQAADPPPIEPGQAPAASPDTDPYRQVGSFPEERSDEDGDGVPDIDDNCPGTSASQRDSVDECGCPEGAPRKLNPCALDDDGDGIGNCDDECPGTYPGHIVGPNGCPRPLALPIRKRIDIKFAFDRWRIERHYHRDLLAIRETLIRYPNVTLRLEGHTDWTGYRSYNRKLSLKRAEAVREFILFGGGIDPARIEAVGYGEERPIASNRTKEGRALNRRTVAEFSFSPVLVPDNDKPPPTGDMESEVPESRQTASTAPRGPRR